jgi:hypothetical protein
VLAPRTKSICLQEFSLAERVAKGRCDGEYEYAHIWAVSDQHRHAHWGSDSDGNARLLCKACHTICDKLLKERTA